MRAIIEYFHIITIKVLEYKIILLSLKWYFINKILEIVIWMMITTKDHSIHTWIKQAFNNERLSYLSNLENLVKNYPKYTQSNMKYIIVYIQFLW